MEREQSTSNLARKEWIAVQAKTLKLSMEPDRFEDLIKKRTEQGLFYADEDYPADPMDQGSKTRQLINVGVPKVASFIALTIPHLCCPI